MQNANLTEPHTDERPFYQLEVIYKDSIDVWYYASSNRGRVYLNDMYSLNEEALPAFIKMMDNN
ncbi:hypothetical protein MHB40_10820 [Lysinibacillus sp. FSL K6-0057]|uniref:hypothetical protein n=1 Tax=Lysinibacillus sp. FSL K6-0057 TaxID=2921411 RepID=UPI003159969B